MIEAPHPDARNRALFEAGECVPLEGPDIAVEGAAADFTAYDDVNVGLIPSDAGHVSYYANGPFANLGAMEAHLPHAIKSPCLLRQPAADFKQYKYWEHGLSIDCEPSLFTPAQTAALAKEAIRQGIRPRLYCSLSMVGEVVAAAHAIGLTRADVELHSAHYTDVPHICSGINTAWGVIAADQTQYTDRALGRSLDANLCRPGSYGPWGGGHKPQPKPKPKPKPNAMATGQANAQIMIDYSKPVGHRLSIRGTKGTWKPGTQEELELMQVSFDKSGVWKVAGIPKSTKPLG